MNVWLISDSHFGHQLILDLGILPRDYEKQIWDSMKRNIKANDILIHLGDYTFSSIRKKDLWDVLGNKILVRGNHDKGFGRFIDAGFNMVVDEFRLQYRKKIVFSHKPVKDLREDEINIHGHLHGNDHRLQGDLEWYLDRDKSKYVDLAPEVWGCRVISLDEVLKRSLKS